eukprot:m.75029 g.75029  ORF g.75029 m.75029 type:complete len:601 (-) comp14465_c0_seq1:306-2108(-)
MKRFKKRSSKNGSAASIADLPATVPPPGTEPAEKSQDTVAELAPLILGHAKQWDLAVDAVGRLGNLAVNNVPIKQEAADVPNLLATIAELAALATTEGLQRNACFCIWTLCESHAANSNAIANNPGALKKLVELTKDEKTWYLASGALCGVFYGDYKTGDRLIAAGVIDALAVLREQPSAKATAKLTATLTLAGLVGQQERGALASDATVLDELVSTLRATRLEERDAAGNPWPIDTVLHGIVNLTVCDKKKQGLFKAGLVSELLALLENADGHPLRVVRMALEGLYNMTFHAKCESELQVERFRHIARDLGLRSIQRSIDGIDFQLAIATGAPPPAKKKPPATRAQEPEPTGPTKHVMLSYQWDHQGTVKKIAEALKARGIAVWMDIYNMQGSTVDGMADAVENAACVLVCMSESYKASPNCRLEANYAHQRQVPFLPLMMETGYAPDGWLGLLLGTRLWYDFFTPSEFVTSLGKVEEAVRAIVGQAAVLPDAGSVSATSAPSAAADVASGNEGVGNTPRNPAFWSVADVAGWLEEAGLPKASQAATQHGVDGPAIIELGKLLVPGSASYAPTLDMVRVDFGIDRLGDALAFARLVRSI